MIYQLVIQLIDNENDEVEVLITTKLIIELSISYQLFHYLIY